MNNIIQELENKDITEKKKSKQIKEIYKYVHSTVLKKYREEVYFNDIFTQGDYNCVTATALYAIIFDHFKIDYQIKETPTHVYLIASPKENQILIESTAPTMGVQNLDVNAKKEYLKFFIDSKQISKEDLNNKSTDELFNEFVLIDTTINLQQLAALQYYNKGVFAYNNKQYEKSVVNFSKAHILYQSNSTLYMLNSAFINVLNEQNIKKKYSGDVLGNFLNLSADYTENKLIAAEYFDVVTNELVITHPDVQEYKSYFNEFKKWVNDTIDIDNFKLSYYTNMSYFEYMNNNYNEALENLNIAYISNSENLRIKQMVLEIGSRFFFTDSDYEKGIDKMEYYFEVFPFIPEDVSFKKYYTYSYLRVIYDAFRNNNKNKGAQYLNRLDEVLERDSSISLNPDFVEAVFMEISRYYVKNHNIPKALSFLERGIQLAPNSSELKKTKDICQILTN